MIQTGRTLSSLSPSFNSYSSRRLTEIAARVVEEFRADSTDEYYDEYGGSLNDNGIDFCAAEMGKSNHEEGEEEGGDDEEFEFAVVGQNFDSFPFPADEIFYDGQIGPYFPLFNTDLVFGNLVEAEAERADENLGSQQICQHAAQPPPPPNAARLSLRKLFIEDREHGSSSSCSSSEAADDLDGVQPDSYCVWTPKMAAEERRRKSNSTGTSKRWRFPDLRRSISVGKESFVVHFHHSNDHYRDDLKRQEIPAKIEKSSAAVVPEIPSLTIADSLKRDAHRRRMTSMPYRRDLVGFISNFNGLSKNLHL